MSLPRFLGLATLAMVGGCAGNNLCAVCIELRVAKVKMGIFCLPRALSIDASGHHFHNSLHFARRHVIAWSVHIFLPALNPDILPVLSSLPKSSKHNFTIVAHHERLRAHLRGALPSPVSYMTHCYVQKIRVDH